MINPLPPTCLLAAVAGICFHLNMNTATTAERILFDFATTTNVPRWQIVNDEVMGGVSASRFGVTNGIAVFRGELSLENNGGFASVRSSTTGENLAGLDAFVVRVRGDGRRYKFTVQTQSGFVGSVLTPRLTNGSHRVVPLRRAPGDSDAGPTWNPDAGQVRLEPAGPLDVGLGDFNPAITVRGSLGAASNRSRGHTSDPRRHRHKRGSSG